MATQASDTANTTGTRARGASPDELTVIAQRAQAFTNASGVAIALSEGNADEIICRARSGASAPDVGAALRVEGTFTGLCIQSGKELRCDDCETDTRVDTAAIRALNIRSMVVTPVREENRVIGVLAVFAPTPHAFTITHVAVLKTMADQISTLLQRDRRAREDGQPIDAVRVPASAQTAKPAAVPPVQVAPVVIKPAPNAPAIRPASVAPATALPKAEPIKIATPMEVVPLATPPRAEKRTDPAPRANFGTFDSVATDEKKPGNRFMMLGAVAVLLIAAAATFVFLRMQKPGGAPAQHAQDAAASAPAAQPAAPTSQPAPATANSPSQPAPGVIVPAGATTLSAKPVADDNGRKPARNSEKPSAVAAEKSPAPEKPVTLISTVNNSQQSKIAQSAAAQSPDAVPSFTVSSDAQTPLSSLARPVATSTPSAAAIEQSQLEPLQLVRAAGAVYPAIAKARHLSGAVVIEVKVSKDGRVFSPKFISGLPIFKDAAFDAVLKYQFKPAKLNGQAIEQTTQIRMNFKEQ